MTDPAALPAADVHAGHVAACLPALDGDAVAKLRACARVQNRLSLLLARRLRCPPIPAGAFDDPVARLALLPAARLYEAARLAGAAWHAASLRRLIRAQDASALVAGIGRPAYLFGLYNADLAVAPALGMPAAELVAAVGTAATGCLAAWLAGLPGGVRERATAKLPPALAAATVPEAPPGRVDAILERVAAEVGRAG